MRIGIDCRTISASAGIGEYTRQLVTGLIKLNQPDQLVLFFGDYKTAENFSVAGVEIRILSFYKYKKFLPLVYSHLLVPLIMSRARCDLILFPANIAPLFYFKKFVIVIHDLAVYKFPELFPDRGFNFDRRILVPRSIKKAARIIAVSQNTKKDLMELFKLEPSKISVVYEGGDLQTPPNLPFHKGEGSTPFNSFSNQREENTTPNPKNNNSTDSLFNQTEELDALIGDLSPKKYFLFIGTIEPRKNLIVLIEAYKKFVQAGIADCDLVLAGRSGWKNADIFEAITAANQQLGKEKIKYLGFVSYQQKALLYQQALALVLPSLYEGFGLPAAEALQFGLPLILTDNSSLPEIGGQAALYAKASSSDSLAKAMEELCANQGLYNQLVAEAYQRAPQFTWEACSQGVLEALKSV